MQELLQKIKDTLSLTSEEAVRLNDFPEQVLSFVLKTYEIKKSTVKYPVGWFFKLCSDEMKNRTHSFHQPREEMAAKSINRNHSPASDNEFRSNVIEDPAKMHARLSEILESREYASCSTEMQALLFTLFWNCIQANDKKIIERNARFSF